MKRHENILSRRSALAYQKYKMTQEAEKHQGLSAALDQAEQEKDNKRHLQWGT